MEGGGRGGRERAGVDDDGQEFVAAVTVKGGGCGKKKGRKKRTEGEWEKGRRT